MRPDCQFFIFCQKYVGSLFCLHMLEFLKAQKMEEMQSSVIFLQESVSLSFFQAETDFWKQFFQNFAL
jgi:hypothetical protein